jgi:hypothetical protein
LLQVVHPDAVAVDLAAEDPSQLGIWHEAEATAEKITVFRPLAPSIGERHGLELLSSVGVRNPHACAVRTEWNRRSVARAKCELGRLRHERNRKTGQSAKRGLFGDGDEVGARTDHGGSDRKEERARPGDDDTLPAQREPTLQQSLCSACPHDIG